MSSPRNVTARTRRPRPLQHLPAWAVCLAVAAGAQALLSDSSQAQPAPKRTTRYDWAPEAANAPIGTARGVHPGRVVWAHDPRAAHWGGRWQQASEQWWTDGSTDQARVDAMLSAALRKLVSAGSDEEAWRAIFTQYDTGARGLAARGYQPGEVVAVKINCNNSSRGVKTNNFIDASPQMVLAMVRQLAVHAHVPPENILVYDARRDIYEAILNKVWGEFKDVRFVQERPPHEGQPKNPAYGDYHGFEAADWVEGVEYSAGEHKDAKLMPRQVRDAKYLVNLAVLKAHSYPRDNMGRTGDEGQTAVTLCGKNHFGSIKGTAEHHSAINTNARGTKQAYSPMVDLAAAPNLGAKTILYALDALYSGRKHQSYPLHFPNPPFNNRVEPYENPEWPSSVLLSLDGVAIDSVGLDILYSQSKHNEDPTNDNLPRILIRENADDYLHEMAQADAPPSKTAYRQGGRPLASLGVHEHWDSDATRRYSRNLDRTKGRGIELVYLPLESASVATPTISRRKGSGPVTIACATAGARVHFTTDGSTPSDRSPLYTKPFKAPAQAIVQAVGVADDRTDSTVAVLKGLDAASR